MKVETNTQQLLMKKTIKGWMGMRDGKTPAYFTQYPCIYIQKTKPSVGENANDFTVVPITISYELPPKRRKANKIKK